jgi:tRNA threonylcarbamoyladenosine biosynthesis protein TsaB
MDVIILNIETATKVCSVSLSINGKLIGLKETNDLQYEHAEKLFPFIEEILKESKISFKNLNAIAVSKGPGSYTGLRIGVSAAKGLCYALNIPLVGVSTLQSMAAGMKKKRSDYELFCPMIDARRMEVYTAIYDQNNNLKRKIEALIVNENFCADILLNNKIVFFGDGAKKIEEILKINSNAFFVNEFSASAEFMIEISHQLFENKQFEDVAYFEPFYLKEFLTGLKT